MSHRAESSIGQSPANSNDRQQAASFHQLGQPAGQENPHLKDALQKASSGSQSQGKTREELFDEK
jgi:hypothetical protein